MLLKNELFPDGIEITVAWAAGVDHGLADFCKSEPPVKGGKRLSEWY
jgi:hypothetical protein